MSMLSFRDRDWPLATREASGRRESAVSMGGCCGRDVADGVWSGERGAEAGIRPATSSGSSVRVMADAAAAGGCPYAQPKRPRSEDDDPFGTTKPARTDRQRRLGNPEPVCECRRVRSITEGRSSVPGH